MDENDSASLAMKYQVTLKDQFGGELAKAQSEELGFALDDEKDKDWAPTVRLSFVLPVGLVAGKGEFTILAEDKNAKANFTAKEAILLRGPKLVSTAELATQDVRFARTEQGPWRAELAEFERGTTVWCRFMITGFVLGPQNNYSVSYRVQLLDGTGKMIYEQPQASDYTGADAYPRRFTEGWFGHEIPATGFKPGGYAFQVAVTDQIANKTIQFRREFTVK